MIASKSNYTRGFTQLILFLLIEMVKWFLSLLQVGCEELKEKSEVFTTAQYDIFVKVSSYGVTFLLFLLPIGGNLVMGQGFDVSLLICEGIILLTFVLIYIFSAVREYVVTAKEIVIKKPVGSFSIPYDMISSVDVVDEVKVSLKAFANAGFFGYFGRFFVEDELEPVRIYATALKQMVQIKMIDGTKIYLSPSEPEKLAQTVKQYIMEEREGKDNDT